MIRLPTLLIDIVQIREFAGSKTCSDFPFVRADNVNYPLQNYGLLAPLLRGSQELFPASATMSAGVHSTGSV
jgi:hypothetical protein